MPNSSPPVWSRGSNQSNNEDMVVPHWHTNITQVRIPGRLEQMNGASHSIVPVTAPNGIINSKAFSVENPKPLMIIGMKDEIGPFAIMVKKAIENASHARGSIRTSSA